MPRAAAERTVTHANCYPKKTSMIAPAGALLGRLHCSFCNSYTHTISNKQTKHSAGKLPVAELGGWQSIHAGIQMLCS
jgi:hypothetical protein